MTIEPGRQIGSFLSAHHVMSLAILGPGGPHATSLFYACDGLAPLWPSHPGTQHSREIEADPRVAATVAPDYADLAAIRGVRVTGAARRIAPADDECGSWHNLKRVMLSLGNWRRGRRIS
jgi:uncharacterized protein YhbP (UPF0306 family)